MEAFSRGAVFPIILGGVPSLASQSLWPRRVDLLDLRETRDAAPSDPSSEVLPSPGEDDLDCRW